MSDASVSSHGDKDQELLISDHPSSHEAKRRAVQDLEAHKEKIVAPEQDQVMGQKTKVVVVDPDSTKEVGIDIVAIHGMWGDNRKTWARHDDSGKLWLPDAFANVSKKATRLIMLEHNSSYYTLHGIYAIAEEFLLRISALRDQQMKIARRPIIFVSHDIGGLIAKACVILASSNRAKYADILESTRALAFFGYPHRPLCKTDLEEQFLRLIWLQPGLGERKYDYRMAKALANATIEVNEVFIHTGMLTQAIHINIYSKHAQVSDQVFDDFTATLGIDGELRIGVESTHLLLTKAIGPDQNPFEDKVDKDWLEGDASEQELQRLRHLLDQAPPVYPPLDRKVLTHETGHLRNLLDDNSSTWNRILHFRCREGTTESVSEQCRSFLDLEKTTYRFLYYFRFATNDIRFNSLRPMFSSIFTHKAYNRISTFDWKGSIGSVGDAYNWSVGDLAACWELMRCSGSAEDAIYILACFDECEEAEALWLLSHLNGTRRRLEEPLKIILLTTAGTKQDCRIAEELRKWPEESLTTVQYSYNDSKPLDLGLEVTLLTEEDPRYANRSSLDHVTSLISACEDDKNLIHMLIAALRTSKDHVGLLNLLNPLNITSDRIFGTTLEEIPGDHHGWAENILSWVLQSRRPLRVHEFFFLSKLYDDNGISGIGTHEFLIKEHPQMRHEVTHTISRLHGLLRIQNDEIHLSHPNFRYWITSQTAQIASLKSKKPWYCKQTENDRHWHVLDTCLTYLSSLPKLDAGGTRFPYAIEHWVHHYGLVGSSGSERVFTEVFRDEKVFDGWMSSYQSLLSPSVKPLPDSQCSLGVAAFFGLNDIIRALLEKDIYDSGTWGRALVESVRGGELSTLQLLFDSMPLSFSFDDQFLHDLVLEAARGGDDQIFLQVIKRIPKSPQQIPDWKLLAAAKAGDGMRTAEGSTKGASNDSMSQSPGLMETAEGSAWVKDSDHEKSATFDWLEPILCQASKLGFSEIVTRLLELGANPNSLRVTEKANRSALSAACMRGHLGSAKILIDHGADPEKPSGYFDDPATPLYIACVWGRPEVVKLLIQNGASPRTKDNNSWLGIHGASHWGAFGCVDELMKFKSTEGYSDKEITQVWPLAVRGGRYKVAKVLLQHGVDVNSYDDSGSALLQAVQQQRIDLCQLLLDNKADPNATPNNTPPPLVQAAVDGSVEIAKLLVNRKASIDKPGTFGSFHGPPLFMAVASAFYEKEILSCLLDSNADPNFIDKDGWTALWLAAYWRDEETVRLLCKADANVNMVCNGRTPLHAAIGRAKTDNIPNIVEALLDYNADANSFVDVYGTPLALALKIGSVKTIEVLLRHDKAKPDLGHMSVKSALFEAIQSRDNIQDILSLLLDAGADANMRDERHRTLLMHTIGATTAAFRTVLTYQPDLCSRDLQGNTLLTRLTSQTPVETVKLILRLGGTLEVTNEKQHSPLTRAAKVENLEVMKFLLTQEVMKSKVNVPSIDGTPLHHACRNDNLPGATLLIDNHANIDHAMGDTNWIYGTPVTTAIFYGSEKCARLLIERGAQMGHHGGHLCYPIIAATMRFIDLDFIGLILRQPGVSINVFDCFGRKPAHLACLRSLSLFNELRIPDEDLSVRDRLGCYPLHYASLSGNVILVEELIRRSRSVGVDINAMDNHGWTPLLWAARSGETWMGSRAANDHCDAIRLLLREGADPAMRVKGIDAEDTAENEWTASDVAKFDHADATVVDLLEQSFQGKIMPSPGLQTIGDPVALSGHGQWFCDCCYARLFGFYYTCEKCRPSFHLCFKCSRSRSTIHSAHDMTRGGSVSTVEAPSKASTSEVNITAGDSVVGGEREKTPYDFEDEILDLAAAIASSSSAPASGDGEAVN